MFASHELSGLHSNTDQYKVLLIGDSSVWGYLLKPGETLSGYINTTKTKTQDNRTVHVFNLGYPTLSLTKDLLILKEGLNYKPDLIIWLVTLESFPVTKQLDSPIVQNNALEIKDLIAAYSLNLSPDDTRLVYPTFLQKTLVGERRALADILRLQLYGVMWAATGIDQFYPESYEPPQKDLSDDETFQGLNPPLLHSTDLSFDVLVAGIKMAGTIPIVLINEPVYISDGQNSNIRYNFFYPRWAYDQYRMMFLDFCQKNELNCQDQWNLISPDKFTNSAIHMNPEGTQQLAEKIIAAIQSQGAP
jgi:hypothetical protein